MTKLIGWVVAGAFGVLVGIGMLYAVGETIDTITDYQTDQ